jgi:protein-S-isoprenylcysteine O-methyltransferase Ste14
MTLSRLQWNLLFTAYALMGTYFEERDLVKNFGQQYLNYRKQVPGFIPKLW